MTPLPLPTMRIDNMIPMCLPCYAGDKQTSIGNGPVQKVDIGETTWHKWVNITEIVLKETVMIMIWCFMSLLTLTKSYRDYIRM